MHARTRPIIPVDTLPAAPTGLTITTTGSTADAPVMNLSWSHAKVPVVDQTDRSVPRYFRIECKMNGYTYPTATVDVPTLAYQDTRVGSGKTYQYRIVAVNNAGEAPGDWVTQASEAGNRPAAPLWSMLGSSYSSPPWHGILQWANPTLTCGTHTSIEIERKDGVGEWTPVTSLAAGSTTYDDTGMPDNTYETYRLRAMNDALASDWSERGMWPLLLPALQTFLEITETTAKTQVDPRVDLIPGVGVQMYVSDAANKVHTRWAIIENPTGPFTYEFTGLTRDTTYYLRARLFGPGNPNCYAATWAPLYVHTMPPLKPTSLAVSTVTTTTIKISWTNNQPPNSPITGTEVWYRVNETGGWSLLTTIVSPTTATYTHTATPGTIYSYKVRVYCGSYYSDFSSEVSSVTLPAAPSSLATTKEEVGDVELAWTNNQVTPVPTGIQLNIHTTGGDTTVTLAASAATYIDTVPVLEVEYTYKVRCYWPGPGGTTVYSSWSNSVVVLLLPPPPDPPAAPSGLHTTSEIPYSVELAWTINQADPVADGQYLYKYSGDYGEESAEIGASATTFLDENAQEAIEYTYKVRCWFNYGAGRIYSDYCAEVVVTPAYP